MSGKTRFWFDTEFMEDGIVIEMLSMGIVCEDGREFYVESADADWSHANPWVEKNVLPSLHGRYLMSGTGRMPDKAHPDVRTRESIAVGILDFVNAGGGTPEFWAYYGSYDWIVMCQLFGRMIDLPDGWPMMVMDVKQLAVSIGDPRLPAQTGTEHHALRDARWTREAWEFLRNIKENRT